MPNVVQGGREYQNGGASEANAYRGKYWSYFEALIFAPNAEFGQKALLRWVLRIGFLLLRQGYFNEVDALFLEGFFFFRGGGAADAARFGGPVVDFQSFLGKVTADIVKIVFDESDHLFTDLIQVDLGSGGTGAAAVCGFDGERRGHPTDLGLIADRAGQQAFTSLAFVGAVILEPAFKNVALAAL